ncbi:hypothetical protein [Sciscionella sediminilitoris]|uniref:hypothetical protein n=1 Tax=Sciscionella sediminilitoris TaxID=1445613 RepID=UPI0004DEE3E1|nr:hypothetical protein [Sciscionella sp. SE31]
MATVGSEERARELWQEQGQSLSPDAREGRTRLILATNALADALTESLGGYELHAEPGPAVVDPSSEHVGRVITLTIHLGERRISVPLLIGAPSWNIYPGLDDSPIKVGETRNLGERITELRFPDAAAEGGWIPVSTLVAHIMETAAAL